jgi:hypothetical protein
MPDRRARPVGERERGRGCDGPLDVRWAGRVETGRSEMDGSAGKKKEEEKSKWAGENFGPEERLG